MSRSPVAAGGRDFLLAGFNMAEIDQFNNR
jgi:hypothetical protein